MSAKLGQLLVRSNVISTEQLQKALSEQKVSGERLTNTLAKLGFISEKDLTQFLSKQYGVPSVNLSDFEIDQNIIKIVPENLGRKYQVIPINRAGSTLIVAMNDPSNIFAIDDLKFVTGYNIEPVIAPETQIAAALDKYYQSSSAEEASANFADVLSDIEAEDIEVLREEDIDTKELEKATEDAPVVKLVNLILTDAIKKRASDIHIEPYEKEFRVRFRMDGILYEMMKPPLKLKNALTSRVKIMSELDIAERRLPQDGRIKLKMKDNKEMDFRVSVLPTLFGEKIVLRLLDKSNLQLDMTKLGFEEGQLKIFKTQINKPWGMILVTGPTGSGKTTTLYSALSELNKVSDNISTAEDPVEFNLQGINQVQMHDAIGLNFAAALRSFLRQDPDIIMVGEIRDFETAEIAVKAALTGHLVLSTLHTNDAPSTINRLLNMGIEPFLVSSSVNLILAQRLARKVCGECKEKISVPPQTLIDLGLPKEEAKDYTLYKGMGCNICNNTGYKGRVALYEIMPLYDELRELILQGGSGAELKREAIRLGMRTLRMSGIKKILEGVTTIEEVGRVTMGD